jgi:SAM-dependent methyltransferase
MYDAVISFQVIEHVQDDKNFLAEICRIVKADGVCILTTPNRSYGVKPNQKPWNRFHVREYTPDELKAILQMIFSDVYVWGIRGNDDIQAIEKARIHQIQKFVDMDPLNLRKLLPASYETVILALLKKTLKREHPPQQDNDFLNIYRMDDYYVTKNNVEDSLDLLAICKKS